MAIKVPYSIKIDQENLDGIKSIADKQHRSVNNAIEVAIMEYIEKHS
jgi:hypothetical protein